eukprot:GDKI01045074.1.p1 GENE.GDKI01045074.1~~GDKI01045074.1.p1  ORF type:complete len:328 (+),score=122.80 GDKI01045074.1:87-1070(+)
MSLEVTKEAVGQMSFSQLMDGFKDAIKNKRSDLIMMFGTNLLTKHDSRLKDEKWSVCEQVLLCSMDFKMNDWTLYCADALKKRFPKSTRVQRLIGQMLESSGEYERAITHYKELIENTPEDTVSRKRLAAVLKGQKRTAQAVDVLNKYLDEFATDVEAWHELAEIYLQENNLSKASFCFEELLMHDPRNVYYAVTYAELQYSLGEYETARKYYSLALQLDDSNARALWGLLLVSEQLGTPVFDKEASSSSTAAKKTTAKADATSKPTADQTSSVFVVNKDALATATAALPFDAQELVLACVAKLSDVYGQAEGSTAEAAHALISAAK